MDPRDLDLAAEFCALVQTADLLEYLGVPRTSSVDEIAEALAAKRRYMQAMQANPKFRDSSRFLLKHHTALQRVLAAPAIHLEHQRLLAEEEKLPLLMMAIDSVLADRVVTPDEEAFVRQSAVTLGISVARYEQVLRERAEALGISLPDARRAGPALLSGATRTLDGEDSEVTGPQLRGAAGHGWWDATFTRMLLECIPGGPGDLVDVYCRAALSATTVLPVRPQLSWLGIDRSPDRLEEARALIGDLQAGRVQLAQGQPHALPIPDESVDYVVAIRALANVYDTRPVFDEAWRVLRPGGRLIVAEPDGLGETFYFDGQLQAYNQAFQRLVTRADAALAGDVAVQGRSGLALGPKLAQRMQIAGLSPLKVLVHASHNLRERPFGKLARRLRRYPAAIARTAGLEGSPELAAVLAEVDRLELDLPSSAEGMCGNLLPLFLAVGVKD